MTVPTLVIHSLRELHELAGSPVGVSRWHAISQDMIGQFADLTGDQEWIHVDATKAATGPFGSTIAHGYLVLSLIPRFVSETLRLAVRGSAVLNYGLDRVRFIAPVPAESFVRSRVTLTRVVERPVGCAVHLRHQIETRSDPRTVCLADTIVLITDQPR